MRKLCRHCIAKGRKISGGKEKTSKHILISTLASKKWSIQKINGTSLYQIPPNYTQYGPITNVGIFPVLGVLYFCPDFHC